MIEGLGSRSERLIVRDAIRHRRCLLIDRRNTLRVEMRKNLADYYAEDMYERDRARDSARVVVPMVVALTHPSSVLDIGCGRGAWLGEFRAHGVSEIVGLDRSYLKQSALLFPPECFRATGLSRTFKI